MKKKHLITITVLTALSLTLPLKTMGKSLVSYLPQSDHDSLETCHNCLALNWNDIWQKLKRKKGSRGGRSNKPNGEQDLCMIVPGRLENKLGAEEDLVSLRVWRSQPLFVWQGNIESIELRKNRSHDLIWKRELEAGNTTLLYEGETLLPDEAYYWQRGVNTVEAPAPKLYFRTVTTEEGEKIAADLEELNYRLAAEGASGEEIVWERGVVFC